MSTFGGLENRFGAVNDALSSGAFDPQGLNYTKFLPQGFAPGGKSTGADGGQAFTGGKVFNSETISKAAPAIAVAAITGDPTAAISAVASGAADKPTDQPTNIIGAASNWFVRGAVIILGFIFVGVGLSMFRTPIVIQNPVPR